MKWVVGIIAVVLLLAVIGQRGTQSRPVEVCGAAREVAAATGVTPAEAAKTVCGQNARDGVDALKREEYGS